MKLMVKEFTRKSEIGLTRSLKASVSLPAVTLDKHSPFVHLISLHLIHMQLLILFIDTALHFYNLQHWVSTISESQTEDSSRFSQSPITSLSF